MRLKILGLIAGVALVAACETAPEESAATSGAGESKPAVTQSGGATATATAPAPAPASQAQAPMGPAPGSQDDLVANVGDRIFFGFDKYNLKSKGPRNPGETGGVAAEISVGDGLDRGAL